MKKVCSWLLAIASVLSLAGTTQAGSLPLIPLCLPQLFGQEPVSPHTGPPEAPPRPSSDASRAGDCLADSLDLLLEYAPEARMLLQSLRPCTPYHIAAAAILEYLAAADAAQQGGNDYAPVAAAIAGTSKTSPYACPANGPCKGYEVAPYPQPVACPLAYSAPGKTVYAYKQWVGPDGRTYTTCEAKVVATTSTGTCCQSCPVAEGHVAVGCEKGAGCCKGFVQTGAAKPCKCCDDCKDCKDCTCAKSAVNSNRGYVGPIVIMKHCGDCPMCSGQVALPPAPPMPPAPYAPMAFGFPPHPMMPPPMPPTPFDELRELHMQRQMIQAAIEHVERELAVIEAHKHLVLTPVAQNTQKVHLVTEHFEAHCDSLHCVNGNPHQVVLEGDVRLICRKCNQTVRIEAPRVVVNMKDGTFAVQSASHPTTSITPPAPPVMLWTPHMLRQHEAPTPVDAVRGVQWYNVPYMPTQVLRTPGGETLPMPCPTVPARPVQPVSGGDK